MIRKNDALINTPDVQDLLKTIMTFKNSADLGAFFMDVCTPQELKALAERWKVCKLLHQKTLSYREINEETGVSLATIVRVARFLNDEPYQGYQQALRNTQKKQRS